MNGYELIRKLQSKMQDPNFAQKFNRLAQELNSIPGLQQEIMRIAERERQKAIKRLPDNVKNSVAELIQLLNN